MLTTECSKRRKPSCRDKGLGGVEEGLVLNTVQICAMARSILLILALPYTLRFSLFEQYWALCLSWLGCDLVAPRSPQGIALPPGQALGLHPAPHPPLVPTGPHSVVNIHQERGRHITRFGRQNSLGSKESYTGGLAHRITRWRFRELVIGRSSSVKDSNHSIR